MQRNVFHLPHLAPVVLAIALAGCQGLDLEGLLGAMGNPDASGDNGIMESQILIRGDALEDILFSYSSPIRSLPSL